jgi:hypothetical protein
MLGRTQCGDAPAIASNDRIDPVIINVAVKDLLPRSRKGEADGVVIPGRFGKSRSHYYVMTGSLQPALKGKHPFLVADVERIHIVPA